MTTEQKIAALTKPDSPRATGSQALWLQVVNEILGTAPRATLLDLCCGECAMTRDLGFSFHLGIDLVDAPGRPPTVTFVQTGALHWCLSSANEYDACIISDGLEHLAAEDGAELLFQAQRIAKRVIVFVPLDDDIAPDSQDPHAHKSYWPASDWRNMGWSVRQFSDWHGPMGALFAWK